MLAALSREGVDVSAVVVQPGRTSQFAFIMVEGRTAARTILWTRGSLEPLAPERLDEELIRSCRGLLVDTMEPAAGAAAAGIARRSGATTLLDAGTLRAGVLEILPHCDYIVASETFAGQIAGGRGTDAALGEMMAFGPRAAVVTLGERGCAARSREGDVAAGGFEVDAVDTTGAGDVFHGAFLFAVLAGWDLGRCCLFANAVAAMKCRSLGGRPAIPSLDEALAFLAERLPDVDFAGTGPR
jgi:ribokinase